MLKFLEEADAIRECLADAVKRDHWLFCAGNEKHRHTIADLGSVASSFGFEVRIAVVKSAARLGDPPVLVSVATAPPEAFTEAQVLGYLANRVPGFPPDALRGGTRVVALVTTPAEAAEVTAFLSAAAAGKLQTSAERAARN